MAIQLIGIAVKEQGELVLSHIVKQAIAYAVATLSAAPPRRVQPWSTDMPIVVFTDGACEDELASVTHGAVVYIPGRRKRLVFGDAVPRQFVDFWARNGKKQVICQAELFPINVVKNTFADLLAGRSVSWFCDNEAARSALVKSYSPILHNFNLLMQSAELDLRLGLTNWYSRVPSSSNIADAASRLKWDEYPREDFEIVSPSYEGLPVELSRS